jgi:hypothetical protein
MYARNKVWIFRLVAKGGWIMEKTNVELKRLKRSLNRRPKMPGINSVFNFSFLDKRAGKKDAQENQICEHDDLDDSSRQIESQACQNRKVLIVDVNGDDAEKLQ